MRIFRVLFYHSVEVSDSLSMITDHLEGFGPLMHILHVLGDAIDALSQREDRFLELLLPTIRQSHMVVNIWLVVRLGIFLECIPELLKALLVLCILEVS